MSPPIGNTLRFLAPVCGSFEVPRIHMSLSTTAEPLAASRMTGAPAPESRLLRVVGVWGLAASIVNITIGGGIFRLPAGVYSRLGLASPLAYLVCALVMVLVVMCFAEAASRVSLTGGLYAYIEVAFGPLIGFLAGVLLWAGMTAATAAVVTFFGDAIGALDPSLSGPLLHSAVVVAVSKPM